MEYDDTNSVEAAAQSIFQSNLSVEDKIERARTELLDLSARNRLLNVPRFSKSAKTIDIVDEKSTEIFRLLVTEGKSMTFLAGAKGRDPVDGGETEELIELALPDDDERDESGKLARHGDTKLQTRMTPNALQKRLLDLYFDARTLEEEQGVNILFLGLGTLKWIDPQNAENIRYAPLILIPVSLVRGSAAERFKLKARAEDFASNLSLEAFLDRVHKIQMPDFDVSEDFSFETYVNQVGAAVSIKPGWSVQPDDIVLGFFSFAKFLMYRDLDSALWPQDAKFTDRSLVTGLVSNGFDRGDELLPDDANIDEHIPPHTMTHIVDADSSQTVAIHEARRGRDLVIQGPPGTGKSQTIANIIAAAVADGKTVLFVAEKMAALEVVKRRLDQAGVGDACLELHSNKANKRALLAELQHVWELGAPKGEGVEALDRRLLEARDGLNAHPGRVHRIYQPYDLSPYQVVGHLTRLRRAGMAPSDIQLPEAAAWTAELKDRIVAVLAELGQRIDDIGLPSQHAWYGVGLTGISPLDLERLTKRLTDAFGELSRLVVLMSDVTGGLHRAPVHSMSDFEAERLLSERLATCPPDISPAALENTVWETSTPQIAQLIRAGAEYLRLSEQIRAEMTDAAWTADPQPILGSLRRLPSTFPKSGYASIAQLDSTLPRFLHAAASLKQMLGVNASATLGSIGRLLTIGERVADAPDASPDAFVAAIWERGLDQASDLAEAVSTLHQVKSELNGKIGDQAWDMDLTATRTAVAMHGHRAFKFLSGDWRRAKALVRTITPEANPDEIVRLLDLLHKGKAARSTIKDGDGLGRGAFGADWRGEKSDPRPLESLVLWMRSLRGVGAEARQIASRLTDKSSVAARCEQVRTLLEETRKLMFALWSDLGDGAASLFPDAVGAEEVVLTQAVAILKDMAIADRACAGLIKSIPDENGGRVALLEMLATAQDRRSFIDSSNELGRSSFDHLWNGADSDWMRLAAAYDWLLHNSDIRVLASRVENRAEIAAKAQAATTDATRFLQEFSGILAFLQADTELCSHAMRSKVHRLPRSVTSFGAGSQARSNSRSLRPTMGAQPTPEISGSNS
jgi:hypothetical protein